MTLERELDRMLDVIATIAIDAGFWRIMPFYDDPEKAVLAAKSTESHAGQQIVTLADHAAEEFILEQLARLYPDIPVFAEEAVTDGRTVLPEALPDRYILVDPLDGTAEFRKKTGFFAVQIALIEKGRPSLGVIYLPAIDVLLATHRELDFVYNIQNARLAGLPGSQDATAQLRRPVPEFNRSAPVLVRYNIDYEADRLENHAAIQHMIRHLGAQGVTTTILPRGNAHEIADCVLQNDLCHVAPWSSLGYAWDIAPWEIMLEKLGGCIVDPITNERVDYARLLDGAYGPNAFHVPAITCLANAALREFMPGARPPGPGR